MLMKISLGERDSQKYYKKSSNFMLKPSFAMSKKTVLGHFLVCSEVERRFPRVLFNKSAEVTFVAEAHFKGYL